MLDYAINPSPNSSISSANIAPGPKEAPHLPEPLPIVSAELASAMMSDEEAKKATDAEDAQAQTVLASAIGKKTAVNIDVISKHFEAHETVQLSSLKKRGLIPPSTHAIKILARGTLDKPLTVIADDFSTTAIKMILLTGGNAIFSSKSCGE